MNAQSIYTPHYNTKNGLPSNNCYFIHQDKQGYIWIATDAGVSRFDGSTFNNYTVDDGLPDNQILQIREDSKGRIWFMALNGKISYFLKGKIHNQENDLNLKKFTFNAIIISFAEDKKGNLWFGTNNNYIAVWNGSQLKKIQAENTRELLLNSYVYVDEYQNLRASTNKGNFIFMDGKFIKDDILDFYPNNFKSIIYREGKGLFWLENTQLYRYYKGQKTPILAINPKYIRSKTGYIYVEGQSLWLSGNFGVTNILFNEYQEQYLDNIGVNQTLKDKDGNIWFASNNGLYKLPRTQEQLIIFNAQNGLPNASINCITMDESNRLWLATDKGQLGIWDINTKDFKLIDLPEPFKNNEIKQIIDDKKFDKILFATENNLGAISKNYPKDKNIQILTERNNKQFVIKNFSIDSTSKITLSLTSGVVIINDRNKLEFSTKDYKEQQDYFRDRSYRVFYDRQQNLWFSNIHGLSEISKDKLIKHYESNPLLTKRINDFKQMKDGTIAMATDGYGIILFKNGKITEIINQKSGLLNNIVHKLFVRNNEMWAVCNSGVVRIIFNQDKIDIQPLDELNSAFSNDINDLFVDDDTAYFATDNGLIYYPYQHSQNSQLTPSVLINSIYTRDKALDISLLNYILPAGDQNFIVNFSTIDFSNKNINIRYRLKSNGYWVETKSKKIEISSLEPGEYVLEISAKTQNSGWSKPIKIKIKQKQFFYLTWWFISIWLVLGGVLIYRRALVTSQRKKNKEKEDLLLQNKILMLEQQALQSMMNPHFIFNVMNSIQHYINTNDNSQANKVLTGFAKLIRKNLDINAKGYISLEEEIDYLNLYLRLEKYRFGNKLNYEFQIDERIDLEETTVPSMLIQPFVENAIWHGIMPLENGGNILIKAMENNDVLQIEIIDDGIGIDNAKKHKNTEHQSKGLGLINERINLINKINKKHLKFEIKQNGKSGTIVSISIPHQS